MVNCNFVVETCWAIVTSEINTYRLRIEHCINQETSIQELVDMYPENSFYGPFVAVLWIRNRDRGITISENHPFRALPEKGKSGMTREQIPMICIDKYKRELETNFTNFTFLFFIS